MKELLVWERPAELWINGSFLTEKENPEDIDFTILLDAVGVNRPVGGLALLTRLNLPGSFKASHFCDVYLCPVYPEGHAKRRVTVENMAYWHKWWGHDRSGNPKGYIRISPVEGLP
jgi:hypothetical protein